MKINIAIIISFIFILPVISAYNASAEELTDLKSLAALTLERNPEIQSARAQWEAKADIIIAAKTLPDLNLGLSFENLPDEADKGMQYRGRRVLSLSQIYPFPGKLSLAGKIAQSESDIYRHKYEQVSWKVITELKKAYYEYFFLQKSLEIYVQEEDILTHFSKVAEQSYLVGKEKQINVLKAQVELAKLTDNIITLEKMKLTLQARINALLNYPAEKPLGKAADPVYRDIEINRAGIKDAVRANNPFLKEISERENRSSISLSLAKKAYMPDFGFSFKTREVSGDFTGLDYGITLSLPVYFRKQRGIIEARTAGLKSSRALYKNMMNIIDYKLTNIINMIDTHGRLYKLYETNFIPQAEQARAVAEVGYKSGTLIFLDWLDTERSYLEFQIGYWEHFKEYLKSLADLEELAGIELAAMIKEEK